MGLIWNGSNWGVNAPYGQAPKIDVNVSYAGLFSPRGLEKMMRQRHRDHQAVILAGALTPHRKTCKN